MRPRLSSAVGTPASVARRVAARSPVTPASAAGLAGGAVRASWGLATLAYDLLSPVALRPRVPGVVGLLSAPADLAEPAAPGARHAPGAAPGSRNGAGDRPPTRATATQRAPGARLADPILLLEGETGAHVATAFLVENEGPEAVSAEIVVSQFAGPSGSVAAPVVSVSPRVLDLGSGEQALVHVRAVLGPELEVDVRYLAQISIPGLSEVTVPIAARRRSAQAA
ncbi:MAG: hypothetical protein JHD16_10450 [Solirubrobacteraceae bacterium]|nr:hypothetical protein [Solirubrobacteraceae bacterium]